MKYVVLGSTAELRDVVMGVKTNKHLAEEFAQTLREMFENAEFKVEEVK